MDIIFVKITLLLYILGCILFWLNFSNKSEKLFSSSILVTGTGFVFHSLALVSRMFHGGYFPLSKTYESVIFFIWALIICFMVAGIKYKIHSLGPFILSLCVLSLSGALFLPKEVTPLDPILQSNWFVVHTLFSVSGFVFFAAAFLVGLMYLLQDRLLKKKKLTTFFYKLPPLDMLDKINRLSIYLGFFLMTLGLVSGFLWSKNTFGSFWMNDPKLYFALFTWLFYLIVLHGRYSSGWRSKKAAYLSVIGFACVLTIFILTTLMSKAGWHAFL